MKKIVNIITLLFIGAFSYSQNAVTGSFTSLANKPIKLIGYNGFNTYVIDSIQANEKGCFNLPFKKQDGGMAYLLSADDKSSNCWFPVF